MRKKHNFVVTPETKIVENYDDKIHATNVTNQSLDTKNINTTASTDKSPLLVKEFIPKDQSSEIIKEVDENNEA